MNNVQSYIQYNEELFFGSKYRNLVNKLYYYISKMSINDIVVYDNICRIHIIANNNKEVDPYGEENWGEDLIVEVFLEEHYPYLRINGDMVDIKLREARNLSNLIKKRLVKKEKDERDERINRATRGFLSKK